MEQFALAQTYRKQTQPAGSARWLREFVSGGRYRDGAMPQADLAGLAAVQGSMMRHYFRLRDAQEDLERRARGATANRYPGVLQQVEEERERMAHELHASAGQALAGIKIHLELIDSCLPAVPEQVRSSLHRIGLLAQEALQQLRSVARRLHPPDWERTTLAGALERLWVITGIPQNYEAQLELAPLAEEPEPHARILLYRVAQEALANAIRHAGAKRLRLRLDPGAAGSLQLTVEDNGKGFDAAAAGSHCAGIGLTSMTRNLRRAGGGLQIESGTWGTRLTAWVPLLKT